MMRLSLVTLFALQVGVFTPAVPRASLAQQPEERPDSAATDSLRRDSVRSYAHDPRMFAMMLVGIPVLALAPGLGVVFAAPVDTSIRLTRLLEDHISVHVTGGRSGKKDGQTWAYSGSVELLRKHWYAEMRVENFHLPKHFQYQSISGGYLVRAKRGIAAGVILGYRFAPRDRGQEGVAVGFPYWIDLGRGTMLLEATYVISPPGPSWNYRGQFEFPLGDGPLSWGFSVEAKTLPFLTEEEGETFTSSIALLFGIRL